MLIFFQLGLYFTEKITYSVNSKSTITTFITIERLKNGFLLFSHFFVTMQIVVKSITKIL